MLKLLADIDCFAPLPSPLEGSGAKPTVRQHISHLLHLGILYPFLFLGDWVICSSPNPWIPIVHFHRLREEIGDTEEALAQWKKERDEAVRDLIAYGKLVETRLPHLCKLNLHLMVCWLATHEENCGRLLFRNEMWVERLRVRRVFSKDAVVSISKIVGLKAELERFKSKVPAAVTMEEEKEMKKASVMGGGVAMDVSGSFMLLHGGIAVDQLQKRAGWEGVWEEIEKGVETAWRNGQVEFPDVEALQAYLAAPGTREATMVHRAALINGNEHIMACSTTMERTRSSFLVRVRWDEEASESGSKSESESDNEIEIDVEPVVKRQRTARAASQATARAVASACETVAEGDDEAAARLMVEKMYVGAVRYFVRLPPPVEGQSDWIRLAMIDFYKQDKRAKLIRDRDTGDVLQALHFENDPVKTYGPWQAYPTPLECIDTKLVAFWREDRSIAPNCLRMFFTANPSTSGHTS